MACHVLLAPLTLTEAVIGHTHFTCESDAVTSELKKICQKTDIVTKLKKNGKTDISIVSKHGRKNALLCDSVRCISVH